MSDNLRPARSYPEDQHRAVASSTDTISVSVESGEPPTADDALAELTRQLGRNVLPLPGAFE